MLQKPCSLRRLNIDFSGTGFYPSAMHRVAMPATKSPDGTIPGRYSIPFFAHISQEGSVYPMPSRVEADGKANYEPSSYQELVQNLFGLLAK